jgi:hypothetical protein
VAAYGATATAAPSAPLERGILLFLATLITNVRKTPQGGMDDYHNRSFVISTSAWKNLYAKPWRKAGTIQYSTKGT